MARTPSRFWHPARRLLLRAQERTRSLVARNADAASLEDVRPRLQHYLKAMYGEAATIEALDAHATVSWPTRVLHRLALVKERGASESTADCIRLPSALPRQEGSATPLEQYRVIAVQHAERIRRASARHSRDVTSDLEKDLYQLAEAVSVDAQIAEQQPGLRATLDAARAESIAQRPRPRWRTDLELGVEEIFRSAWQESDVDGTSEMRIPRANDAEANATWARRTATSLEAKYGRKAANAYRRVPEMTLWQTTITTQLPDDQEFAVETETRQVESEPDAKVQSAPSRSQMPGPSQSRTSRDQRGGTPGRSQSENASSRSQTETGDDHADRGEPNAQHEPEVDADKESGKQGEGAASAEGGDGQGDATGIGHSEHTVTDAMLASGVTYQYPEWDFNVQALRAQGTTVRIMPPSDTASEWAASALATHAREVHRARRQFERLRSHRLRLRRQLQGDELDLEACVEAMVDRRMGISPTDRLYSHVRPGRRELAITLLIDVSGSTSAKVEGEQRVIDIERIAALVATSAFDALGDDYSILAFSSASASNVRVHTLKAFGESQPAVVRQRIGALEPHGNTRLGAAVRHATSQLSKHPAPHRLLLILSDGKPHDYDGYFVDYAIQDSRHAVMSARLEGIHPFCITVDTSEDETYLTKIFGSSGYRVVTRPSQLSQALLVAVQRMIGGSS